MKQLRRTIRRILIENQNHYEKLAGLLTGTMHTDGSPDVPTVDQAVSLGEALECIEVLDIMPSPTGYRCYYELILSEEFFVVAKPHLQTMKSNLLDDCEIFESERKVAFVATNLSMGY